jgi:type I restriction enzyme S subunit
LIHIESEAMNRARLALSNSLALVKERKQTLITSAVTGQFDVTTARAVA